MEAELAEQAEQERQRLEEAKKEEERRKLEQEWSEKTNKSRKRGLDRLAKLQSLYPAGTEPTGKGLWYEVFADTEVKGVYKGDVLFKADSIKPVFILGKRFYILAEEIHEQGNKLIFTGLIGIFSADEDWEINSKGAEVLPHEDVTLTISEERIFTDGPISIIGR